MTKVCAGRNGSFWICNCHRIRVGRASGREKGRRKTLWSHLNNSKQKEIDHVCQRGASRPTEAIGCAYSRPSYFHLFPHKLTTEKSPFKILAKRFVGDRRKCQQTYLKTHWPAIDDVVNNRTQLSPNEWMHRSSIMRLAVEWFGHYCGDYLVIH